MAAAAILESPFGKRAATEGRQPIPSGALVKCQSVRPAAHILLLLHRSPDTSEITPPACAAERSKLSVQQHAELSRHTESVDIGRCSLLRVLSGLYFPEKLVENSAAADERSSQVQRAETGFGPLKQLMDDPY